MIMLDRNALEAIWHEGGLFWIRTILDLRKAWGRLGVRYSENDRITATVEWDNKVEDGLHSREEFNF